MSQEASRSRGLQATRSRPSSDSLDIEAHERLHMGIGFVTPAEKHDGRAEEIIAARRTGLKRARARRLHVNRGCSGGGVRCCSIPCGIGQRL